MTGQPPPVTPPPVPAALPGQPPVILGNAATVLPPVGRATLCQAYSRPAHTHAAARFVWHHILPLACGGQTTPANLASLCDNCHYAVHAALWRLAHGLTLAHPRSATSVIAARGHREALARGTVSRIPHEA